MATEKKPFFNVDGSKITIDLDEAQRAALDKVELGAGIISEIADDTVRLGNKMAVYLRQKAAAAREKMETTTPPSPEAPTDSDTPTS